MKTLFLSLCSLFCVLSVQAQYDFEKIEEPYENLENAISLNNGLTWSSTNYEIPIPFDFHLFGETYTETLHVFNFDGNPIPILTNGANSSDYMPTIFPFGTFIVDRGLNGEPGTEGSLSDISYLIEGEEGSRILKIEWKNAGFLLEIMGQSQSNNFFTNFQAWLYEGTNVLEYHFGESETQPLCFIAGRQGPIVGFNQALSVGAGNVENGSEGLFLSGSPTNPTVEETTGVTFMDGVPENGSVYRFSPQNQSTIENKVASLGIKIYPNPVQNYFSVVETNHDTTILSLEIVNSIGQKVKTAHTNFDSVNVSSLPKGIYFVKVKTDKGIVTLQFVKK